MADLLLTVIRIRDLTVTVVVDDSTIVDDGVGGLIEADLERFELNNPSSLNAFVRIFRGNSQQWKDVAIPAGLSIINAGGPVREWSDLDSYGVAVIW